MIKAWLIVVGILSSFIMVAQSYKADDQSHIPLPADSMIVVGKIKYTGNKITKDRIITRELEFKEGDTLSVKDFTAKMQKSQENLLNRSLFNFVTFSTSDSAGKRNVTVHFTERWYIWPIPILSYADRNFNVWWETKDFSRLNYGLDLRVENFRGRMEILHIIVQNGYDKVLAAKWGIPYIDKKQKLGLGFSGGLHYNHEVAYRNEENRPVYKRFEKDFAAKRYFAGVGLSYRIKYNNFHSLSLSYNHVIYNDSLLLLNPGFTYGDSHMQYLSLSYVYKLDYRDFKPYPLKGYYFDVQLSKIGLGILSSTVNVASVEFNFDHYLNLYKRWFFAYRISALYTNDGVFQPYFLTTGMGLRGFDMRGYELVFIEGQKMGLFKSNIKYEIIPMKVHRIKWIKTEKFGKLFYALYGNLFFDMGYVNDVQTPDNNPLGNQLLWTVGAGVDLISFYDIVLRFEYSVNKQNKTGFYLGLVAPI